jgi:hypothetical protein
MVQRGLGTLLFDTDHPDPAIDLDELLPDLLTD